MPETSHVRKIAIRCSANSVVFRERRDNLAIFTGDARMYELKPPFEFRHPVTLLPQTVEFVIVSKIHDQFAHETFIFACNEDALVSSFAELPGSQGGEVTHAEALAGLGYTEIDRTNPHHKESRDV